MSRPGSLCLYYISVSQPRFDVETSFLLSTSLLLGHSFSFRLRHHSVVLSLQASRDSNLLVCLFSYRDLGIRSQPSSFFNYCNSCHDLKSMSRPFFLPFQSQPHFSVSTCFNCSAYFYVATWIPSRDLDWCPQLTFLLQHQFWSATNNVFFLCRDLEVVSRH